MPPSVMIHVNKWRGKVIQGFSWWRVDYSRLEVEFLVIIKHSIFRAGKQCGEMSELVFERPDMMV
ncbi:hypothetical protein C437_10778 [Haloarcula vallismortis ATCC 29715]|uniref:Uncharacterized protein n=1 Tax=Haloarcula vallismortis ATCC 29715 TaxID=662477 RepID=M0JF12_HALVA|nr:hypothetical protein C437_10778 [Haloarcula vallismortis ATCC 29715]